MSKITWVNFLHIYQPPWQNPSVLRTVTTESYEFLVSTLLKHPDFRATINIAGTLLDAWADLGYSSLIASLRRLLRRDQIEVTGSSYSHAFLPMLPAHEVQRQITLQESALKRHLGVRPPAGFFLPEMAYSSEAGAVIQKMGYRWIILDPMTSREQARDRVKYLDRRTGLTVVFRNRSLSKKYPPEEIFKRQNRKTDEMIITATDGELYGHFHKDWQQHLKKILASDRVSSITVSDYIKKLTVTQPIKLRSASWETSAKHIRRNDPFNIWYSKENTVHQKLWQLAHLAMDAIAKNEKDANFVPARTHLDRGLASCSWWWASEVKTSPFAPTAWNPDEIEHGALELVKSIRSLSSISRAEKIKAEKIYSNVLETVWTRHWTLYDRRKF